MIIRRVEKRMTRLLYDDVLALFRFASFDLIRRLILRVIFYRRQAH